MWTYLLCNHPVNKKYDCRTQIMPQETMQSSTSFMMIFHALKVLLELWEKREDELTGITTGAIYEKLDVDNNLVSLIFDHFHAHGGVYLLMEMSISNHNEIEWLWYHCHTLSSKSWLLDKVKIRCGISFLIPEKPPELKWIGIKQVTFLMERIKTSKPIFLHCQHLKPASV